MAHVIRLRGPWEYRPIARAVSRADGLTVWEDCEPVALSRIDIPFTAGQPSLIETRGRVLMIRRFHCPTNLTPNDHVVCVFQKVDELRRVALNEQQLGEFNDSTTDWQSDITTLLVRRNELKIDVELPVAETGRPLEFSGEVYLAIHS